MKARWKGKVRLSDLDPPNGYLISGEGEGGVAGFAKGGAKVALSDKDGGTLLSYDVEAQIGGKLAQLGQRLINSAAKKTADDFFVNFAKAVAAVRASGWLDRPVAAALDRGPRAGRSEVVLVPGPATGQNRLDFARIPPPADPAARKAGRLAPFSRR